MFIAFGNNTILKRWVYEIMVKIGYVRVSREKQDPESQIKLLKDMGIKDQDIFVDHGMSGWTDPTIRPVYKEMMKRISNKDLEEVTTIVFSEFSRLGRNAKESMYELLRLEHMGIAVQSLSKIEAFINDVPMEFQIQLLSSMMVGADLERKHHKERTKWALENVAARGSKSGKPIGRPKVNIDFEKIEKTRKQYDVSENVARKICGYSATTFYEAKKRNTNGSKNEKERE
jgi:DNA invertase Pin-like site-specific DNA recombinase